MQKEKIIVIHWFKFKKHLHKETLHNLEPVLPSKSLATLTRLLLRKFVFSCYAVVDPSKGERQWRRRGAGAIALTLDYAKIVKFEVMQWPLTRGCNPLLTREGLYT
jgi:hypothetical protein